MKLLVLVGSTHVGGFNDRLAQLAVRDLPSEVVVSRFDLVSLPYYDEVADAAGNSGPQAAAFRAALADTDAILFTSPAYNGSLTAVGKNAIDVASRPRDAPPIGGKPILIAAAVYAPGMEQDILEQARRSLTHAGGRPLERGFGISNLYEAFDETGLVDKAREQELHALVGDLLSPVPA